MEQPGPGWAFGAFHPEDMVGRTDVTKKDRRQSAEVEELELVLGEPVHGGACVARDESGRVVFVRLGIPGERVRARVTSKRNRLAWADVVEVLEASEDRVASPFPAGDAVGGAELAHVSPAAGRSWKRQVLRGQLRRVGGQDLADRVALLYGEEGPEVLPTSGDADPADPLLGRRTRARFVVGPAGGLGMRQFRSHQVIELEDYPFLDGRFADAGVFTDALWRERWQPGDDVTLVAPNGSEPLVVTPRGAWNLRGEEVPANCVWEVTSGQAAAVFEVEATGFWQVHRDAPATLATEVTRACGPLEGKRVMELYSGSGLLTYFVADRLGERGAMVTLEQSPRAVAQAEVNLRALEGGGSVQFYEGDVDPEAVADLAAELGNEVDVIILDPPRTGVGREVARALCATEADRIVLVSCDPAAGARDLAEFRAGGYELEALKAYDLFPHTHHFEMISTLQRLDGGANVPPACE